ncbi:MAG TPA: DNA repair protein RecO [Sphingomonadaceae bacterium]|nr:DNA repair protein RecO [Sphingomonadaceae bacterium]
MHLDTRAIVIAVLHHGEHGAIVRALTPADGVQAGYVRGGRSRRLRPVLIPGNVVAACYRARTEAQLPQLSVELVRSRAALLEEALAASAIDWVCALAAAALPEGQTYPAVHQALDGVLTAIESAPSARGWAAALVRYELLVLAELGFGLALDRCVVTDATKDLVAVSPRSGAAVSAAAAEGYRDRLLDLPSFLTSGGAADWPDILAGLAITGHFLARDILIERRANVLAARERLVDRLRRAGG